MTPPVLVSKDEIRLMLHDASHPEYVWNKEDEKITGAVERLIIAEALERGRNVIVHDTNLSPRSLRSLKDIADKFDAKFCAISFLAIPTEVCLERDAKRTGFAQVGENVINRMVRENLENGKQEQLEKLIGELNEHEHGIDPVS